MYAQEYVRPKVRLHSEEPGLRRVAYSIGQDLSMWALPWDAGLSALGLSVDSLD